MNFGQAISTCMGKYATFSGRASRSEYWWFYLFCLLMSWGASLVGATTSMEGGADIMSGIVSIALILPTIDAAARRLHDTGRSGWWQLLIITIIGIIPLIIWMASRGSQEENEYGAAIILDVSE